MHFAYPLWLWGSLVIPLVWAVFALFYQTNRSTRQLEKFIDKHLLPYLLVNSSNKKSSLAKTLLLWTVVWALCTVALAGPRWNFREMETFSRDQSLVILLDLSESMNATDLKPSRLVRAKQKIENLINLSQGTKIGLVAFAADPHMIAPITEDKEMIRYLLPSLETDLVYMQGSRLSYALEMASTMLEAEPGNNKAILVISDGGFEDASSLGTVKKLTEKGLVIHVMGVGTREGALLKDAQGNVLKKNGSPILSRLETENLVRLSNVGEGHYLEAQYFDHDETIILRELEKRSETQLNIGKKNRIWDESFYLLVLPALPVVLWWFRRGYVFSAIALFLIPSLDSEATALPDYFKNSEELGKQSLDKGDYESAIHAFKDPYRLGVAYYKAGDFAKAEEMFLQSKREEVSLDAAYNLGNALAQQMKLEEAVKAYEEVLEKCPDHIQAKENLELVKNMLANQSEQQEDPSKKQDSEDNQKKEKQNEKKSSKSEGDSDPKNGQTGEDQEKEQNPSKSQDSDPQKDAGKEGSQDPKEQKEQDSSELEPADQQESLEKKANENEDKEGQEGSLAHKSQEDQDADLWLNQISNDPKAFLKNKFYIESKNNETKQGVDPW